MSALMSQTNGKVLVVYFTESRILNQTTIQQIGAELEKMADRAEWGKLLLNFSDVRFMSSAMLGKLIKLNKKCKQENTHLKLCSISEEILEVFKLMRLHKIIDIYQDENRALIAFEKV